jgi:hypothetical protein
MNGLNKDDIIRMAREIADKDKVDPLHNDMVTLTVDELGKLLIAEREACAKWCEAAMTDDLDDQAYYVCQNLAAAIRARGQE